MKLSSDDMAAITKTADFMPEHQGEYTHPANVSDGCEGSCSGCCESGCEGNCVGSCGDPTPCGGVCYGECTGDVMDELYTHFRQ